ncbi:hypothetical protein LARI1_G008794 [Lachnellula arida]|uniref:Uncharacterized protein n=1 Tax=Lachnellula arida TaxID=1316785 RepID=A0A8T9B383_9HELO|nr:hypothetical protein LARI1_G008794 [Lachnellula arida]
MEGGKAKSGASEATAGLSGMDKQVADLKERYLPHIPHLLSINTDYPYRPEFPHENQNTPFRWWEVKALQYMTLVSDGERGIAMARGNWEEEYAAPPTASVRSSIGTPNTAGKERDPKKAAVKYSLKDYKGMKETGVKPSPRPNAADAERKPGHSRNISNVSLGTPTASVLSSEEPRQNGASGSARIEVSAREERSTAPRSSQPEAREKARPSVNGHIEPRRDSLHGKDSKVQKPEHHTIAPPKHGLPPRPQSPAREKHTSDTKPQKRPLESASTPAEKRTKVEQSRTPSGSLLRKPDPRTEKQLPIKSQKEQTRPSQDSPHSRKATPISKPIDTKSSSRSSLNKPLDLPPLLSPLPADLDNGPLSQSPGFSHLKKPESGRNSSSNTPSKSKLTSDTIVVKSHRAAPEKSTPIDSSPLSTPPNSQSPFHLPPILSPSLPEPIEQELHRLQQKAQSTNTVEARHEKVRQPGAPGTTRTKVGHPPKRSHAESSKSQEPERERAEAPPSLIVKLKYKKQSRKTIERMLQLRPTPNKEYTPAESHRKTTLQPSALPKDKDSTSESEDEPPLAVRVPKAAAPSRKRPSTELPRASEPPPKRLKPDGIDSAKSNNTPVKQAFKSPAVSGPPDRNLLSTPKRGDAMKSVAMRRVDSDNARTPQATSTSTPASAEKPRLNGNPTSTSTATSNPDVDKLRTEEKRLTAQANKLKHKMDDILKPQLKASVAQRDDGQRKLAFSLGLECLCLYMSAFSINARILRIQNQNLILAAGNWESILKLWAFMDGHMRDIPVLYSLSALLGALCREELRRVYLDPGAREYKEREAKLMDNLKGNERDGWGLWRRAHGQAGCLRELGVQEVLGPWSTIGDAMRFSMEVLGQFSRRERIGWKRDV